MSDFIDKLNLLVRSRINGVLNGAPASPARRRDGGELSLNDAEVQIKDLRKHIDDALNAEDEMQRRAEAAATQVTDLDQRADNALLQGDDASARDLVQQMQRAQRAAEMLNADLENHRRATSQLIEQVNQLEALVSDRRAAEAPAMIPTPNDVQRESTTSETPITVRVSGTPAALPSEPPAVPVKIGVNKQPTIPEPTVQDKINSEVDKAKVEDDLARRRARLSKPDNT